ncbi:histidine kinase [Lentimicrobium saccharophilum]|uniref:Histidine kinase n=1 Tax=Lentimicrobium saccharophilum TaxID=1678841 RepID=A0A0S7BZ75_9BACT|nr:histidine kinase [Lentimicrobium saccharophilum]GAP42644.1 histidine kinase [Lentimicrobium saccharophilum]
MYPGFKQVQGLLPFIFALWSLISGTGAVAQLYYSPDAVDTSALLKQAQSPDPAAKSEALAELAYFFRQKNPERSLLLAEEALKYAHPEKDLSWLVKIYFARGAAFHYLGNYPESVRWSLDALDLATKTEDPLMWFRSIELLVLTYLYSSNDELAMKYASMAFPMISAAKSKTEKFGLLIRLGWVYKQTGNFERAIPLFLKADQLSGECDTIGPANTSLNALHLGSCYYALKQTDSALYFFRKSDRVRAANHIEVIDRVVTGIGQCFRNMNRPDSAMHYFQISRNLSEQTGDMSNLATVNLELGNLYREAGLISEALAYYRQAVSFGKWVAENHAFYTDQRKSIDFWFSPSQDVPVFYEISGYKTVIAAYRSISEVYRDQGNYRDALINFEEAVSVEDLLEKIYRRSEVIQLSTRYETSFKDQKIQMLLRESEQGILKINRSRVIILILSGFMALGLVIFLFLFRNKSVKARQQSISLQQRLLRSQMNPHFIYNSLSCIQSFILSHEPDLANKYLAHFARLMRNILKSSAQEFVTLEEEIVTIENYLELQRVRFADKFDFRIEVDENLDTGTLLLPPMMAQPFIENSIEHGIKHKETKGLIEVRFWQSNGSFYCEIRDDGVGREKAMEIQMKSDAKHRSVATTITRERLAVINRKRKHKISLGIIDLKDDAGEGVGTRVVFEVPMRL